MKLEVTTFYTEIKGRPEIDLRDNRGKVHNYALVIIQVLLALLCHRDGNVSRIHEHMNKYYSCLVEFLGIKDAPLQSISRAQLPLFLARIDYELLAFYVLAQRVYIKGTSEKDWYGVDGKELRGSIAKGSKRGESIVQVVSHKDRKVKGQSFYNGEKESEIPAVRTLLELTAGMSEKVTMDALHLNPKTLEQITSSGGSFLVGLKGNQSKLKVQMKDLPNYEMPKHTRFDEKKGHGRKEERFYLSYDIKDMELEARWKNVKFKTLIQVLRKQRVVKKEKEMYEESYYLSNIPIKNVSTSNELFDAVRCHWQVEVNNYIRDVVLKEDKLHCSNPLMARTLACFRTLVLRLLDIKKPQNRRRQLDDFSDDFHACLRWLKTVAFL